MRVEQSAFIQLLADYIGGKPSIFLLKYVGESVAGFDWQLFARYAREQSLEGIVYAQLKKSVPKETIPLSLLQGFDSEVYLSANRGAELTAVLNRLQAVPVVVMKGMVLRDCYPCPMLRSMGDIDLVIHPADRAFTDAAMLAEGYTRTVDNPDVWTYSKENIYFEIHDHMFYESLANKVDYRSCFDSIWQNTQPSGFGENVLFPTEEFHFLYLMVHLAKHIANKGYGFRGFLDVVFFIRERGGLLNWERLERELAERKLLDFTKAVFSFCRRWFDVEMPLETAGLTDVFFCEITLKMFRDGVFGLENEENTVGTAAKKIQKTDHGYFPAALVYVLQLLFPPYRHVRIVPRYRFVDGKPWLMPAAWIYRWCYSLVHQFRHGLSLLLLPFVKRKEIRKRADYLSDWGL